MKKTLKNALLAILVTGFCLSIVGITTAEDPTYGNITISPVEPARQSDVTFSVNITGVNIEEVRLILEECTDEFCHPTTNLSMTQDGETWEVTKTLEYPDTTVGHVWLVIKSDGTWYNYDSDKTDFTVVEGEDGDNGGNGGNGADDTPGFELVLIVISLVIALSIYKRKRMR
ncbi:MAG: Heimdall-CTERM domain-containing surface protein [Petrotogales bacterium]